MEADASNCFVQLCDIDAPVRFARDEKGLYHPNLIYPTNR
jgi:hypothetical protein